MLNFPPPPQPPIDVSQLENLAEYYRSVADYYRRASEIATQQLAHVEALLHPRELSAFSEDLNGWLETQTQNGSHALAQGSGVPQLSAAVAQESHPNEGEDKLPQPNDKSQNRTDSELLSTKQIADYFYPDGLSDSRRQKVHASLSNTLSEGNHKFWRRVKVGQYVWKQV